MASDGELTQTVTAWQQSLLKIIDRINTQMAIYAAEFETEEGYLQSTANNIQQANALTNQLNAELAASGYQGAVAALSADVARIVNDALGDDADSARIADSLVRTFQQDTVRTLDNSWFEITGAMRQAVETAVLGQAPARDLIIFLAGDEAGRAQLRFKGPSADLLPPREGGFKYLPQLRGLAESHSAASFAKSNLGGTGAKRTSHVVSFIVANSRGAVSSGAIASDLSMSGDWHYLHVVDLANIKATALDEVKPSGEEDLSRPIVLNHKGEIVDGRHRVALARERGIMSLQAWMPAFLLYKQEQFGRRPSPRKASKIASPYKDPMAVWVNWASAAVDTTVSALNRMMQLTAAQKRGAEFFRYDGTLIATSRPFCRIMQNVVLTVDELSSIETDPRMMPLKKLRNGDGNGQPGILQTLGGWRCRHILTATRLRRAKRRGLPLFSEVWPDLVAQAEAELAAK